MSDNQKQMVEDFAAAVRAIEKSVRPWKIATIILSVSLAACLLKIVVD